MNRITYFYKDLCNFDEVAIRELSDRACVQFICKCEQEIWNVKRRQQKRIAVSSKQQQVNI